MALVVGVHGVAQQFKGEEVLRAEWAPPLQDGLRRAVPIGDAALRVTGEEGLTCAFYGDIFRPPGRALGVGDPFLVPGDATSFDNDLLALPIHPATEFDHFVPELISGRVFR